MSDRDALFANVLDRPADDTARLVLADWLQENGEEDFGRFIRAGVVASRFRGERLIKSLDFSEAMAGIAAFAKTGQPALWLSQLGIGPLPLTARDIAPTGRLR